MGAKYRDMVRMHSRAKGSARAVLNILADYANDDGLAWPGRATIANDTGMSERTVIRCLQTLCDQARISLEDHGIGGRGQKQVYRIWLPEIGQPAPSECDVDDEKRVTTCHPLQNENEIEIENVKGDNLTPFETICHPLDEKRVTNEQIKGDNLTKKGDKSVGAYKEYNRSKPTTEPILPKALPTFHDFGIKRPQQGTARTYIDGIQERARKLGLSPKEFTALVDALLIGMNKLAVAELDTRQGNNELGGAQECALSLVKMNVRTPEAIKDLFVTWYQYSWRGKKGQKPDYETLVDHVAELPGLIEVARKTSNGTSNGHHPANYERPATAQFSQREWDGYEDPNRGDIPY